MWAFFGHKYDVAELLKIHKEHLITIKYYLAYHVQQRWGEKSATPGWGTILHYMMIIRQKLQRERREGKSFSQRCKRCDGEKKEGINVGMMRNLYPGATAADTTMGCYLKWESRIGRANMYEQYNGRTVLT